jgi:hypothetical protein
VRVEESADHQIGFLGAAVPGTKAQALEADLAVHDTPTAIGRRRFVTQSAVEIDGVSNDPETL